MVEVATGALTAATDAQTIVASVETTIGVALAVVEEAEGATTVLEVPQDAMVSTLSIEFIASTPMACAQLFPEC